MSSSTPLMYSGDVVNSDRILYTPADFAKTNLAYLQEVGTLTALHIHESCRCELSSYLFFMVVKGSGTLTVEGVAYNMKKGDCAFVDCMLNYKHKSSEDLWQLKWVHFNGPNIAGVYDKYRDRGGKYSFTPSDTDFAKLEGIVTNIQATALSSSYIRDMEINEKLNCLLTVLMKSSWNPNESENASKKRKDLRNVRDYLDTHYAEEIKLDKLSGQFFVNKYYLTRIFREQYGITINKYLNQVRITNAKKLLRFTELSVEQISVKCGYNDTNFFIRMFKRLEGMTPGEFRNRWKSQQ